MAKKQTLNMFEAHLEKIALAASLSVCLAVILIRLMVGSGVDNKRASQVTSDAAQEAQTIVSEMKRPGDPIAPPELLAENLVEVPPLALREIDQRPIDPPVIEGELPIAPPEDIEIPAIPPLKRIVVDITHAQAQMPDSQTNLSSVEDVDFVTVEAVIPMAQLRQAFRRSFGDSRTPKNPVKYPEPIAGVIDLQHSRLLPDGAWGPWRSVLGLKNDPFTNKAKLLSLKMSNLSNDEYYEVMLPVQQKLESQSQVLRPSPYQLTDSQQWQTPSESRKLKAEQTGSRNPSRRAATTVADRPTLLPASGGLTESK